jgi:hypothetical protein
MILRTNGRAGRPAGVAPDTRRAVVTVVHARRAPGSAGVRFAPFGRFAREDPVSSRHPRALARGPAPVKEASPGEVLVRSRGLQLAELVSRPRARPRV